MTVDMEEKSKCELQFTRIQNTEYRNNKNGEKNNEKDIK